MGRILFLAMIFSISLPSLAVKDQTAKDSQIYLDIDEQWQPHSSQFKQVLLESFKRLKSWKTSSTIKLSQGKSAEELINENASSKLDGIILATLKDTTKEGDGWFSSKEEKTSISIRLYDRATGNLLIDIHKDLARSQPDALFANLESELPLTLKIKLAEVGSVIKKNGELVYFNLGSSSGIRVGNIYRTFKPGDKLVNQDGDTFGWIEETTGIVKVTHSQSTYSTAQILLGRLSINENNFIEMASEQQESSYIGNIISVHEDQVAIGLGENVGVAEGASYAVFKDIKTIKDTESFREKLGEVRIHSVHEDFSVGELSLSNHYELTKALIKQGDPVEEIKSANLNLVSLGQIGTNSLSSTSSDNIIMAGYQSESDQVSGMVFRYRAGYGNDFMLSAGVMNSINHSPNFFYGLDAVYLDGIGANFFLSVDVPTPVDTVKVNMETGYMAGVGDDYEGFNLNISIKYPFEALF